jgi:hypothetical protein
VKALGGATPQLRTFTRRRTGTAARARVAAIGGDVLGDPVLKAGNHRTAALRARRSMG